MTQGPQGESSAARQTFGEGYLFGVPVGGMGWFSSLVISIAVGFAAFFAATFLAILALLFYNSFAHHALDFNLTYRVVGFPIGVAVMALAFLYMGRLWVRGLIHRA